MPAPPMSDYAIELTQKREEWVDKAACAPMPTQIFFADDAPTKEKAKQTCGGCAVRRECLEYALVARIDAGIWGGLDEDERRRLWRRLRSSQKDPSFKQMVAETVEKSA